MEREQIVQLFFFGFLAVMAYELYLLLSPFLVPIVWAMLLSFLFHPAMVEVNRLLRNRSAAAALITGSELKSQVWCPCSIYIPPNALMAILINATTKAVNTP